MSRAPCPICDFPLAATEDAKQCARDGVHLGEFARSGPYCWKRLGFLDHRGPAIDWRARALKAEAVLQASCCGHENCGLSQCERITDEELAAIVAKAVSP